MAAYDQHNYMLPPPISSLSERKCRARYGLEKQHMWCGPCRRKKKCIRYSDGDDEAGHTEGPLPEGEDDAFEPIKGVDYDTSDEATVECVKEEEEEEGASRMAMGGSIIAKASCNSGSGNTTSSAPRDSSDSVLRC